MKEDSLNLRSINNIPYEGRDLEAMSFALRYHRWILELFDPYLGSRVAEIGAGSGSFSELLLTRKLESLIVVEPSCEMFQLLKARLSAIEGPTKIRFHNSTCRQVVGEIRSEQPDSILYVNVMEHIAADEEELLAIHNTLESGGRVFIFVPALKWLYSAFDKRIGHFRRYTKSELVQKCERTGFQILKSHYVDFTGILPWWVKFRLLGSDALSPSNVRYYDNLAVPVIRIAERLIVPPIGKNLLLIAEKR
jgi:2-polyprenyl-3-methyl-5-hydroxy-6-metoxy-1,4-benzoquinol methylase